MRVDLDDNQNCIGDRWAIGNNRGTTPFSEPFFRPARFVYSILNTFDEEKASLDDIRKLLDDAMMVC